MRVTKTSDGFQIEDEPMRLEGAAADRFLADLNRGPTKQSQEFEAMCRRTYERVQEKLRD